MSNSMRIIGVFTLIVGSAAVATSDVMATAYDMSEVRTSRRIIELIEDDILSWINEPVLVAAINEANIRHANRTIAQIRQADTAWRASRGIDSTIRPFLENDAALYLKQVQSESRRLYAEIFIMDYQGCQRRPNG